MRKNLLLLTTALIGSYAMAQGVDDKVNEDGAVAKPAIVREQPKKVDHPMMDKEKQGSMIINGSDELEEAEVPLDGDQQASSEEMKI